MDLIGEFHPASSKGNRYALTAICMLTGFTWCIPLKTKKAEEVVAAYMNHIYCVCGPSKTILSDNGSEFKNKCGKRYLNVLKLNIGTLLSIHHNVMAALKVFTGS